MSRGAAPSRNAPQAEPVTAPDPTLVGRFRADVERSLGGLPDAREPIALAVSGGPDSMAMLALSIAAFPGQPIVATMDHGLRAGAANEAAMVAAWCAGIGVAHQILRPDRPIAASNVQAGARAARYEALSQWAARSGASILATAHHADDQAETFLMRAARGSGVAGLAGIRGRQRIDGARGSIDLIRPLLGWRVTELRDIVKLAGIPFVDDPSNADGRFARTGFRALLRDAPLLDPAQIAKSAANAAEADAALDDMAALLWRERHVDPPGAGDPIVTIDMTGLPRELRRRITRLAIATVRVAGGIAEPAFDAAANVEPLLDALVTGKTATQAGIIVSSRDDIWRFLPAPPRRSL